MSAPTPGGALARNAGGPVAAALVAALVWGCAPPGAFRPAPPLLPGRDLELGAGGVGISPRPYVEEPWRGVAQAWGLGRVSSRFDLGAVAAFDLDGFAAGATLRLHVVTHDRFALAVDAELGWAWAAISIPVAVRLFDETWLYASPRFGNWGQYPMVALPLGLSVRVVDGFFVRVEGTPAWPDFSPYQRRFLFGLAAAQQL